MNGKDIVYRTIVIRGQSEGIDKVAADLNKLAAAHQGVTIASEETEKSTRRLEQSMQRSILRFDAVARAQNEIEKQTKLANKAVEQGYIDAPQREAHLARVSQHYSTASTAAKGFAQQTGLARHELINLGRQAQDVGVSLASGQSPLMVLVQQGSQIADVFATSGTTLRGFFTQAAGWAARFAVSAGGVATAVAGIGVAALYMASSFASAQREIDKVLASGGGAASGMTRGGINRIAEGAAGGGMSIAEARSAATAFAATGKIYEENITAATNVTRDFARAMGIDAADATKQMAAALQDPSKGALDLNKSIQFLNTTTLEHVRTLQTHGKLQEAQAALMNALAPAAAKQAQQIGFLTRTWNNLTAALSDYDEKRNKMMFAGPSDEEKLTGARQTQQTAQGALANAQDLGLGPRSLKALEETAAAATKEVERLEQKLRDAAQATEDARFLQLSNDAKAFSESIIPAIDQVNKLTQAIEKMKEAQAARAARGMEPDTNLAAATRVAEMNLAIAHETVAAEQRKAEIFAQNAAAYSNVSATSAQILAQLQSQLSVASAVGVQAQIRAQYEASVVQMLAQGVSLTDAMAVAEAQRAIAVQQIQTAAQLSLLNLQLQRPVSEALTGDARMRAEAQATYNRLMLEGVNASTAMAIATEQEYQARAKVTSQIAEQIHLLEQSTELIEARLKGTEATVKAEQAYDNAIRNGSSRTQAMELQNAVLLNERAQQNAALTQQRAQAAQSAAAAAEREAEALRRAAIEAALLAEKWKFIPFAVDSIGAASLPWYTPGKNVWETPGGYMSQFNPKGYTSQTSNLPAIAESTYGLGGFDPVTGEPNAQGLEYQFNRMGGSIPALLGRGVMTQPMVAPMGYTQRLDTAKVSIAQRAIELLPAEQQAAPLHELIKKVESTPYSLQREEIVKQLNDKLQQLIQVTEENTSATSAMTEVLSPFYTADPRRTHLGFRAFAGGGIMTADGMLPLRQYQGGGMATSPQVAVFGEGSTPEAYVPVPSGRIPVELRMPANNNQRPIRVTINVMGNADNRTVASLKATAFQQAQAMRRVTG